MKSIRSLLSLQRGGNVLLNNAKKMNYLNFNHFDKRFSNHFPQIISQFSTEKSINNTNNRKNKMSNVQQSTGMLS
jgi:hypothetical protein